MHSINAILATIPENKSVRAVIPLSDSSNKLRLGGILQAQEPPRFKLIFPMESLDGAKIDVHRKCSVVLDMGGQNISLTADIDAIVSDMEMQLIARDFINHESVREFFRVDVATPLVLTSIIPAELSGEEAWQLQGETIDLSGAGLLAAFPEPVEPNKRFRLNIILPSGDASIVPVVGHAVRTKKIDDNLYHVAFHFDQISEEDRDRIMASCFEIQRRHLRMKL